MKKLRVLSIDWDYFIKATAVERSMLFPDGGNEDLPESIKTIVWGGRYGVPELEKIGIEKDDLKTTKRIIMNGLGSLGFLGAQFKSKLMVTDSHVYIYGFIQDEFNNSDYEALEVYNIDFHHDYYGLRINYGEELNCGNWVNAIFDETSPYRFLGEMSDFDKYYWIGRSDSDKGQVIEEQPWFSYMSLKELEKASINKWDLIFICKSGMWSPPHLDLDFYRFYQPYTKILNTKISNDVSIRWNTSFKKIVEGTRKARKEIIDTVKDAENNELSKKMEEK